MAVISQYLGGVMTFPLGDINPYQPSSASYFCNLQSFDKVLVGRRTNRYSKTINTSMKIEIDFDMGYETNIPWIEAI